MVALPCGIVGKWMDEVLGACRGFWEKLSGFDALE